MHTEDYRLPIRKRDDVFALVSPEDYEWASQFKWYMLPSGYVWRYERVDGKQRTMYLHRDILGLRPGEKAETDHINRVRHDCRRENLRVVTRSQNNHNTGSRKGTSKYRGVSWSSSHGKWLAMHRLDGKRHYLGYFEDEDEAGEVAHQFRLKHMSHATD